MDKYSIKTIEELARVFSNWIEQNGIDNFHLSKLKPFLEKYDGIDWSGCPKLSGKNYCRHKQKLDHITHYGTKFDIFILTWKPGCGTRVHNHPNTGCIYKILEGELNEDIYDSHLETKTSLQSTKLIKGQTGYIDDNIGFHRIWNPSKKTSVSIHIYESGYVPKCFDCFES